MARQSSSIFKFEGKLEDISFYKTQDGYLAREKGGVSGARIKNDPMFARTRENNAEFARAGKGSLVLSSALRTITAGISDKRMASRLVKEMMRVIHGDATSIRGERNVVDGEAELLRGFEFNVNTRFTGVFKAPFTTAIDRVTGNVTVDVPAFNPSLFVTPPNGARYFRLISAAAAVDFETGEHVINMVESAIIPVHAMQQAALQLAMHVTPASTHPLFLALGIKFLLQVNGQQYTGAASALSLVDVDGGV